MSEDREVNKKHKGIKKGSSGICFQNFASRIVLVYKLRSFLETFGRIQRSDQANHRSGQDTKENVPKKQFFSI